MERSSDYANEKLFNVKYSMPRGCVSGVGLMPDNAMPVVVADKMTIK